MLLIDGVLVLAWGVGIWMVLIAAIPEHAVGSTKTTKRIVSMLLPEGWAFFTRDSREATYKFYADDSSGNHVVANPVDVPLARRFSPSRSARVRSISLSAIVEQIPKQAWRGCTDTFEACVRRLPEAPVQVKLPMHKPAYCGRGVVKQNEPVPWAWRESYGRVNRPANYVRVDIACERLSRESIHG